LIRFAHLFEAAFGCLSRFARLVIPPQRPSISMNEAFPDIQKIQFEGPKSRNPLAFKHYNADEIVGGKKMRDHLRFGVAYWHAMRNSLSDPFGGGTAQRPWDDGTNSVANAQRRVWACFEFMDKLGVDYYCFHDRDVAPELRLAGRKQRRFRRRRRRTRKKRRSRPARSCSGAPPASSPTPLLPGRGHQPERRRVFAFAAAQVKKAMDVTHRLGGEGYTFWGGREGYATLLEHRHEARARSPRPVAAHGRGLQEEDRLQRPVLHRAEAAEPTKHQYDSDAAACLNFLREYDLLEHFKLNLETNHATLAGHSMQHEIEVAIAAGALGSIDANTGDAPRLGHRPVPDEHLPHHQIMLEVLKHGRLHHRRPQLRRQVPPRSFEPVDLFHAHIGGMDAFARGLKIAHAMIARTVASNAFIKQRYAPSTAASARRSRQAKSVSKNSKPTCSPTASLP
jgi:xylose isomerase